MKPHPILSTSFLSGYRNNPPLFITLKSNFSFKSHGILSLSPVITSCSLSLPSAIFSLKPRSVIKFAPRLTRLLCSSVLAHQATATLNPELAALPHDLIQQGPKLVFRTTRREGAKTVFRWATRAASRDRIKGEKSQEIESISASAASRVKALQTLKTTLGLPVRLGWNGDPCVPQQHPWSGADCQFDESTSKWVIDGLGLDNQGLKGFLQNDMSKLRHLQSINLSGNNIHGAIPSSLGAIPSLEVLDLSYNSFNGSIPETIGQLTSLQRLYLNSNSLSGRVPATLGGRLLHRASFNFTDNHGLCGIPGLRTCGPHLTAGAKIGLAFGVLGVFLLIVTCSVCCWKRRQNILRTKD